MSAAVVAGLPKDPREVHRTAFIDDAGLLDAALTACLHRGQWVKLECKDTTESKRRLRMLRNKKLLVAERGTTIYVQNPRHAG